MIGMRKNKKDPVVPDTLLTEQSESAATSVNNATSKVQIRKKREKLPEEVEQEVIEKKKAFEYVPTDRTDFGTFDDRIMLKGSQRKLVSKREEREEVAEKFKIDENGELVLVHVAGESMFKMPEDDSVEDSYEDNSSEENPNLKITDDDHFNKTPTAMSKSDNEAYLDSIMNSDPSAVQETGKNVKKSIAEAMKRARLTNVNGIHEKLPPNHRIRVNRDILTALVQCHQQYLSKGTKYKNAKIVFEDTDSASASQHLANGEVSLGNARVYNKDGMPRKWNSIFEIPLRCNEEVELDLGVSFEVPAGYGVSLRAKSDLFEKFGLEVTSPLIFDSKAASLPITVSLLARRNTSYLAKFQNLFIAKVVRMS